MMKRILALSLPMVAIIGLLSFRSQQEPTPKAAIRTLIIDPGHGGFDQGAKGSFSTEAQVSLAVALKFGKALEKEFPDLKIVYTRTKDIAPGNKTNKTEDNRHRADMANKAGGDLFIAIHCNSAPPVKHRERTGTKTQTVYVGKGKNRKKTTKKVPTYRTWTTPNPAKGTETYIWAVNKNDAKVNAVNLNEEFYGEAADSTMTLPDPSDPAEKARMLIYAQQFFKKSLSLADLIEKEFVAAGRVSRGVKQRNHTGIWVLQATGMPSVLVELGFLTNLEEEKYLNSEAGQQETVDAMVAAFKSYKQKLESRQTNTSL